MSLDCHDLLQTESMTDILNKTIVLVLEPQLAGDQRASRTEGAAGLGAHPQRPRRRGVEARSSMSEATGERASRLALSREDRIS